MTFQYHINFNAGVFKNASFVVHLVILTTLGQFFQTPKTYLYIVHSSDSVCTWQMWRKAAGLSGLHMLISNIHINNDS